MYLSLNFIIFKTQCTVKQYKQKNETRWEKEIEKLKSLPILLHPFFIYFKVYSQSVLMYVPSIFYTNKQLEQENIRYAWIMETTHFIFLN